MTTMSVVAAKTHLSRLLDAVVAGEEVVITRNGVPVARLVAVREPASRELGFLPAATPDERFAPLTGEDLHAWT
ncbi:MAG: type II toxin-antitoxin system prevent-host-death family antitoxin [Egibacteraceae bacterium]